MPTRINLPSGRSNVTFTTSSFRRTHTLGTGGEGTADLHVHRSTHEKVVVKVIKMADDDDPRPRELRRLLWFPNCNRILNLLAYEMNQPERGQCSLLFEYCHLGDLKKWRKEEFVERNNKQMPESYLWRLFIQMTQALAFIHYGYGTGDQAEWIPIVHRDIKPHNVLVVSNGTTYPSFKLADFGISKYYDPDNLESESGTYEWQPPEIPIISTFKADVWALGALIHFCALGKPPIEDLEEFKANERLLTGYVARPPGYWNSRVPREVTPINIPVDDQIDKMLLSDEVRNDYSKVNHVYSDELNAWMMRALDEHPRKRASVDSLLEDMIPFAKRRIQKLSGKTGLVDLEIRCGPNSLVEHSSGGGTPSDSEDDEDEDEEETTDEEDLDDSGNFHSRIR